jgi:hypothetical protein
MPIALPRIDGRNFRQIADGLIARIPSHTAEWTNFNEADPGVTLLELFAFMAENMLYLGSQIPERNRLKFLQLLGIPLASATPARGLVAFGNVRGPLATARLDSGLGLNAGSVPFVTERGLDVLPTDTAVLVKRPLAVQDPALLAAYGELYRSFAPAGGTPALSLYETVAIERAVGIDLLQTVDGALWVALLRRPADKARSIAEVREAIAGRVLTLGLVLAPEDSPLRTLAPGGRLTREPPALVVEMPATDTLGAARQPSYAQRPLRVSGDGEQQPLLLEVTLPAADQIFSFDDVDPLEAGTGALPPGFDDSSFDERLVSWLRIRPANGAAAGGTRLALLWAGVNAMRITQRDSVAAEVLGRGNGAPDQQFKLARSPAVAASVVVTLRDDQGSTDWAEIDDLYAAGPEAALIDSRLPGYWRPGAAMSQVFQVDAEAGVLRFGDGLRGARPAFDAEISARYDITQGQAGNVAAGAVNSGARLPPGLVVANPLPTWGGLDAEHAADGERAIRATLRHRDRAVTADDFRDITLRTPGLRLARVEVLPAWRPGAGLAPGEAPGAVTVLVVPAADPVHPLAPRADAATLAAVCQWLDPRRLITTEVAVTSPQYKGLWLSVGLRPNANVASTEVAQRVRDALNAFLSPLPLDDANARPGGIADITPGGWPLTVPVLEKQLLAVVARVPGVLLVEELLLAAEAVTLLPSDQVAMAGIELPEVLGIGVAVGTAQPLDALRSALRGRPDPGGQGSGDGTARLPVPFVQNQC